MYSKLPAEPRETPTKVVFEGVDPGSAAAQRLYYENFGDISSFQQKARQSRLISGQPTSSMQQQLPNGGRLTYTFNNGLETIHVKLAPRGSSSTTEPGKKPELVTPPQLAIDVLFNPELYETGDVWAFTETTVYHPAVPPRVQPDARIYSYDGSGNPINDELAYALAGDTDYTGINGTVVKLTDRFNWFIQAEQDLAIITPGTAFELTYTLVQYPNTFPFTSFYPPNAVRAIRTYAVAKGRTDPGTPAFTTVTKEFTRDQRRFFNGLGVAGAIGDPEGDNPYESKSVDEKEDVEDGRLVPCETIKQGPAITREIVFGDGASRRYIGIGFLALPTVPITPGAKPVKTVIDLYLGSANSKVKNTQDTATKEAKFGTDDSSFQYDVDQKLSGDVRVREFRDQSPIAVKVSVKSNMARSFPQFNYAPSYVVSDPDRTFEWYFAATPTWVDGGAEPADINAVDANGRPTMGDLLEMFSFTDILAAKVSPVDRKVYSKPEWPKDVAAMTKICRIEWTPADTPNTKGKATITGA